MAASFCVLETVHVPLSARTMDPVHWGNAPQVRISDQVLLVPDGTTKGQSRYIHASHHKWGGKANLLEVNCDQNSTSWTILLYDKFTDEKHKHDDPPVRAGEVCSC